MSVKFLLNFKLRRIYLFFGILFFFAVLVGSGMWLILERVNQHREKIIAKIKEEFGLPIAFDNIKTGWYGWSLEIFLQNVTIYDPSVPIAFVAIDR